MAWRFLRRIGIGPGLRLNIGKSGVSLSMGRRGAWLTVGKQGMTGTVGIPGTGLHYTKSVSYDTVLEVVQSPAEGLRKSPTEESPDFTRSQNDGLKIQDHENFGVTSMEQEAVTKLIDDENIRKSLRCLSSGRFLLALGLLPIGWFVGLLFVPAVSDAFGPGYLVLFLCIVVALPAVLAVRIVRKRIRYPRSERIEAFEINRNKVFEIAKKGHLHLIGKPENWKFQRGKFGVANPFRGPRSNVKPLMGASKDGVVKFWLYPDFLLVRRPDLPSGQPWAAFRFEELNFLEHSVSIDEIDIKIDFGNIVGKRFTHMTLSGEPDRRFKDNPILYSYEIPMAAITSTEKVLLPLCCRRPSVTKIALDIFSNPQRSFN
ncbi:MAG: hypothetical protein COW30_17975 [Rhodospirillales bacterium CG15_BIG_FIL_POST_REV_8_21_14_020_66_15]|nr:MAG: hypothetical protein COW30_17975 [Rhodospirillales bacterium CG15_BIG_FIL_POST_REV_8_21_14_020_66_15]